MPIEPAWLQAGSTVVLVLVTGYYTYLLHIQNKRERRSYHTDTLRERVREWHEHLPEIQRTKVESAELSYVFDESHQFRVAPRRLMEDNYFQDLLKHHGNELRQHKIRIEGLHEEFKSLKGVFVEEFNDTETIESASLELVTTDQYPSWVFDQILLLERTEKTKEDLHQMVARALERNTRVDCEETKYPSSAGSSYSVIATQPRNDSTEDNKEIVTNVFQDTIDRVDEYEEFDTAVEAASILDEIELEINALQSKLVEYEGMATYPGECEYIR